MKRENNQKTPINDSKTHIIVQDGWKQPRIMGLWYSEFRYKRSKCSQISIYITYGVSIIVNHSMKRKKSCSVFNWYCSR